MASSQSFVDFVLDQIAPDCDVTARKMFGEYGVYSHGKLVGLVCDDRLLIKPTEGGRAWIGDVVEGEPYPGAKLQFHIQELDDSDWLSELIRISFRELPEPKPKKPRKKKAGKPAKGA